MPFQTGGAGVTTLSDLQIDVDKDWKAHGIYNLGDLTPKVNGAYNLGSSANKFDTVYAGLMSDSIYKRNLRTGVVDTSYLTDDAATAAKVDPSVDLEFVRSNDNTVAGGITPKVDGAYNLGSPTAQFDNAYANNVPPLVTEPVSNAAGDLDSIRDVGSGALVLENLLATPDGANVVDNTNLAVSKAADIIYQSELTVSKGASVFDHTNLGVSRAADIAYQSELQPVKAASIFDNTNLGVSRAADIAYQPELQPVKAASIFDNANLSVSKGADIAYQPELLPVKFRDIFEHGNLSFSKAKDIVYHGNFNLGSTEARDKISAVAYGIAKDIVGAKGFTYQIMEERTFAFRTETPNHAYWHRLYNTPAAFETVYQNYGTSIQHKGTTPSKSAPGTADPNPQPGACWTVSMLPDGTQVGGFGTYGSAPFGVAWDGTYFWNSDTTADYIYQLKADGTQVGGFASPTPSPMGLTWDGVYLWNTQSSAVYVYQLRTDGTQVGGFPPAGPNPQDLAWDGQYLWNPDYNALYIYQLKADGTQTGGGFPSPGAKPIGIAWDGVYLWNTDNTGYIYQLTTDGTQVGGFASPTTSPRGVAWDGAYLWHDVLGTYIYQLGNAGNFDVNYRIFAK